MNKLLLSLLLLVSCNPFPVYANGTSFPPGGGGTSYPDITDPGTAGSNGSTNPAINIDTSTASAVTGINIKTAATAGGVTITATDSGANTPLTLNSKGTGAATYGTPGSGTANLSSGSGNVALQTTFGVNRLLVTPSTFVFTPTTNGTASTARFQYVPAADTSLTLSTNALIINFGNATRQHATGALTLQTDYSFSGNTDSFVGASTLTDGATMALLTKSCGANGTCTNESGLYHVSQALTGTISNSFAINVAADTGATNNYAARFAGDIQLVGSAPVASTCGGGAVAAGSSDHKGQVTGITAATACTITFNTALPTTPACTFSTSTGIAVGASAISTAAVTTTMVALTGTLYYICF